jgi:hypothetical protein
MNLIYQHTDLFQEVKKKELINEQRGYNEELYEQLTSKEISLIKLVKAEEFLEDLYGSILYPQTNDMFPPKNSYNKIKNLLKELRQLNK